MDEIEPQEVEPQIDEVLEEPESIEEPKVEKPKETLEARKARLQRELKQVTKKLGEDEPEGKEPSKNKTDGLDETQLDYLDLKGISEPEDIQIIENIAKKTGQTVRQILKDEYVISKLSANKAKREVKDATPSNTKRAGAGQTNDFAQALAKYEQTGVLPDDFELRSKVVNARMEKESTNKPAWRT